jgi:succinate-semialdehyde dehydrogenase/glutarate-semialdehyde dehydrogenase
MTNSSVSCFVRDRHPGGADHRAIRCEEVFCPVASVVTWTDDDELVRMVNDTEFGLVAYICARDLKRASSWPN